MYRVRAHRVAACGSGRARTMPARSAPKRARRVSALGRIMTSAPATRRLLDGMAVSIPRRSTEPTRPRHRREVTSSTQVRLTGKHPFNVEPPLPLLMAHGHSTPASIHYVRNHGKVPVGRLSMNTKIEFGVQLSGKPISRHVFRNPNSFCIKS